MAIENATMMMHEVTRGSPFPPVLMNRNSSLWLHRDLVSGLHRWLVGLRPLDSDWISAEFPKIPACGWKVPELFRHWNHRTCLPNKPIKRFPESLIIKEPQWSQWINTAYTSKGNYFNPKIASTGKNDDQLILFCWWKCKMVQFGKYSAPQKTKYIVFI